MTNETPKPRRKPVPPRPSTPATNPTHHTERATTGRFQPTTRESISKERVRQIEQQALWKLKRILITKGYQKDDLLPD